MRKEELERNGALDGWDGGAGGKVRPYIANVQALGGVRKRPTYKVENFRNRVAGLSAAPFSATRIYMLPGIF